MTEDDQTAEKDAGPALWRGIDLSGVTVLLGTGTGRLIELLLSQIARADGQLVVFDYRLPRLVRLAALGASDTLSVVRARHRRLPLLGDSADLCAVNGVLRDIPDTIVAAFFGELWRVLVPGGSVRISDILEPSTERYDSAWKERNRLVRLLAAALNKPAAVAVDLPVAAKALRDTGFEDLACSLLPGCPLTDEWLEETVNALHGMAARLVDRDRRHAFLEREIPRLVAAYALGGQRAAERFVLSGRKVGNLALDMQSSFTEDDLLPDE